MSLCHTNQHMHHTHRHAPPKVPRTPACQGQGHAPTHTQTHPAAPVSTSACAAPRLASSQARRGQLAQGSGPVVPRGQPGDGEQLMGVPGRVAALATGRLPMTVWQWVWGCLFTEVHRPQEMIGTAGGHNLETATYYLNAGKHKAQPRKGACWSPSEHSRPLSSSLLFSLSVLHSSCPALTESPSSQRLRVCHSGSAITPHFWASSACHHH